MIYTGKETFYGKQKIKYPEFSPFIHFKTPFCCYLLKSTTTRKTYFGYTKNVSKRLRQHNGEIKGGAKATRYGRPWIIICVITGFPDKTTALQFEWRNHHPLKKRGCGINSRLQCLINILKMPKWTPKCISSKLLCLHIYWFEKDLKISSSSSCIQKVYTSNIDFINELSNELNNELYNELNNELVSDRKT